MTTPALRHSFDDLSATYGLTYSGNEFEPEFRNGDTLVFDSAEKPRAGDIVAIWLRPEHVREGRSQVAIYRVHMPLPPGCTLPFTLAEGSECEPVLILNSPVDPKRTIAIPASRLLAVHCKTAVFFRESEGEEGGEQ